MVQYKYGYPIGARVLVKVLWKGTVPYEYKYIQSVIDQSLRRLGF